jgi:hypothetical protein
LNKSRFGFYLKQNELVMQRKDIGMILRPGIQAKQLFLLPAQESHFVFIPGQKPRNAA